MNFLLLVYTPQREMPLPIITEITSLADFKFLLDHNPGVLILKLGAEWCGPCKKIEPLVKDLMSKIPTDQIQCAIIDVDESFELYALLKSKRMVNGIPAILAYDKGNVTYIPDRSMAGTDPNQIVEFFNTCLLRARALA